MGQVVSITPTSCPDLFENGTSIFAKENRTSNAVVMQLKKRKKMPIVLNIGLIRMNILMLDTRNVEQTKYVHMYIEEFILVDIWIHWSRVWN